MKRNKFILIAIVFAIIALFCFTACDGTSETHEHELQFIAEVQPTCTEEGVAAHYRCTVCNETFKDERGIMPISDKDMVLRAQHTLTYYPSITETCETMGRKRHWHCEVCDKNFSDSSGIIEIKNVDIKCTSHDLIEVPIIEAKCDKDGQIRHWHCEVCKKNFADANGKKEATDLTIPQSHTLKRMNFRPSICDDLGYIEHWHCVACGKNYADEDATEIIADVTLPPNHILSYVNRYEPRCATGHIEHWHCDVCGKNFDKDDKTKPVSNILIAPTAEHDFSDEVCSVCGKKDYSEGLTFERVDDGYRVTGLGTCTDRTVKIQSKYEGLPVTEIGIMAFRRAENMIAVIIPNSVRIIHTDAFADSGLESIIIPDSVTDIGHGLFSGCEKLTVVKLGNGITRLENNVFLACRALKELYISKSVTTIYSTPVTFTFNGCGGLQKIEVDSENPNYHSAGNCLIETKTGTLIRGCNNSVIPDDGSVRSLSYDAFESCKELESITIPQSVTKIADNAFNGCGGLRKIDVDSENPNYHSVGNCLIETATGKLIRGCNNSVIPTDGSITCIGDWAFSGCKNLTRVEIPSSVTEIGNGAFKYCSNLTSIEIPSGVTRIGSSAFSGCKSLTSVDIPNGITEISDGAFFGCRGLTSIEIPSGVTRIGSSAFGYCSNLTRVEIPSSVTEIGNGAFDSCSGLTSIEIPDSVTSIGRWAFGYCDNLTSIEIPSSVMRIDYSAFNGCSNLTTVTISNGVKEIWGLAFSSCTNLKSVFIPKSVEIIGKGAFGWSRDCVIYCEAEEKPEGWHEEWSYEYQVVWGYKPETQAG